MFKKFLSDKISNTKNALFFLLQASSQHGVTFTLRLLYELVVYQKECAGFSIFDFVSSLIKSIFSFYKVWTL